MSLRRKHHQQEPEVPIILDFFEQRVVVDESTVKADAAGELRRTVPRQQASWNAMCRFRDDPEGEWRDCLMYDISSAGCGLRVFGLTPEEVHGRKLDVVIHVSGDVRNATAGMKDDLRIGIEFIGFEGDANFFESLDRSDTRW